MSTLSWARLAGAAYLLIVVTALFSEVVVRGPLIAADPAETAANIAASELQFRLGGVLGFVTLFGDVIVAYALFEVFRAVSASLIRITMIFRLLFVAIMAPVAMFHFAPLFLLSGSAYLQVIEPAQLEAMAAMSLRMHSAGFQIALTFFGVHLIFAGWLFAQTRLIPRALSLLVLIAGAAYVINSFAYFLSPELSRLMFPYIYLAPLVGEVLLTLWLLFFGVNMERWSALKAKSAEASAPERRSTAGAEPAPE